MDSNFVIDKCDIEISKYEWVREYLLTGHYEYEVNLVKIDGDKKKTSFKRR